MKNTLYFVLTFFLFLAYNADGQVKDQQDVFKQMRTVHVVSPDVASLGKYVETPVLTFNGLPNIGIPIYEIKCGDITLPISLSYHPGGIKSSEEASWVGLGWSLIAGGVISHQINGQDDQYVGSGYFNSIFPTNQVNQYSAAHSNVKRVGCTPYNQNGTEWDSNDFFTLIGESKKDGQPDLYTYNFGNYSGKYIQFGANNYADISQFINYADSIVAITPEGYKYSFGIFEASWTLTGTEPIQNNRTRSAFYLTQISSPKGKKIVFKYKRFRELYNLSPSSWGETGSPGPFLAMDDNCVVQLPSVSEQYGFQYYYSAVGEGSGTRLDQNVSTTFISTLYLDRIEFGNGYVEFEKSAREDMYGVKLDKINVRYTNGSLFKSFAFAYNYFTGQSTTDFFDPSVKLVGAIFNYPVGYRKKRLKLLSLEQEAKHTFEYYEGTADLTLPYKSSFSQDYWGYNNGINNVTLIPDFRRYVTEASVPSVLASWTGANREPHPERIKAGTLKKITYPTKGSAEFDYQIHDYTNLTAQQATVKVEKIVSAVDIGPGIKESIFTLSQDTYVYIEGGLFCDSGGNTGNCNTIGSPNEIANWTCGCVFSSQCGEYLPANVLFAIVERYNPASNSYGRYLDLEWDISKAEIRTCKNGTAGLIQRTNVPFAPGQYRVRVNYPDNKTGQLGDKMANLMLKYNELTASATTANTSSTGGGLRVSRIRSFDPESGKMMEKSYQYEGGKMMRTPLFYAKSFKREDFTRSYTWGDAYFVAIRDYYTLYSNTIVPYSFSANGSLVGYEKVIEKYSDGKVGRIEYNYRATPDNYTVDLYDFLPGIPSTSYLDNGFLNRTAYFDKDNTLLKEVINTPTVESAKTYWPYFFDYKGANVNAYTLESYCPELVTRYYPIQMGKVMVQNSLERDYTNASTYVEKSKTYQYNPQVYLQSESTTSSDGTVLTQEVKYPNDYSVTTGWIKEMKDKNMLSYPLETLTKRDNQVINGSFVNYKSHDNMLTPNQIYQIETSAPKAIASSAPSGTLPTDFKLDGTIEYDLNGNIITTQGKDDIIQSYIWGYNNNFPIAEVKNASVIATATAQPFSSSVRSIPNTKQYPAFAGFSTAVTFSLTYAQPVNLRVNLTQATATTAVPVFALAVKDSQGKVWFSKPYTPGSTAINAIFNLPADTYTIVYNYQNNTTTNPGLSCTIDLLQVHQNIFYTSFEEDNVAISNEARTGGKSHTGNFTLPLPAQAGNYVLTYWTKGGALTFSTVPTQTITGTTQNGWTYYECSFTNIAANTLLAVTTGTVKVDELRFYPQGAQMTTYTYDGLAGMTSVTDAANVTTYYEYDSFKRLQYLRDQDGNIVKSYVYHYKE